MLKPNTTYKFTDADKQFVLELAKVGHVSLLTSQVSLITKPDSHNPYLSFKEYGSNENDKCEGLKLPHNWVIEYISAKDNQISITFGVLSNQ